MYEKLCYFRDSADQTRQLLMRKSRGRSAPCMNMLTASCNSGADGALEGEEYLLISGGNIIRTATILIETGMLETKEPVKTLRLDTAAGLITITAEYENRKCKAVVFDHFPSFVYALNPKLEVPGVCAMSVDMVYDGIHYVLVSADSVGHRIGNQHGAELIRIDERLRGAIQDLFNPIYPENSDIHCATIVEFIEPLKTESDDSNTAVHTVVVPPDRFDQSPCGTRTSAQMTVLHREGRLMRGGISDVEISSKWNLLARFEGEQG
jgi:proline racemase